ncbi:peptidoglycan-binding domain-containing protein [Aquimarina litoralis]|uniref:peptidoglycan-binding domain-containing protein n=1 Tax=Aquimarina litoralis TaxID=584605 RepID=UPI001C59EC64|nr:peptidoglycan-binding domain-containing protein [Aquimarina litoralis]MBW1296697.1 peptidoglycan-binding protein [Aquimarina litoralis]
MKGIIIFLLVIITLIMGYNQYNKYQRFHPKTVNYVSKDTVDNSYHDPKVVMNYYEAIEMLNGYVISQWSTNRIDVRNPKKDNSTTRYAVNEYQKKLGKVKYYEAILMQSTVYKSKGLSNDDIKLLEQNQLSQEEIAENMQKEEFYDLFQKVVLQKTLKTGDRGPWVYEMQKYLTTNGYTIAVDGNFRIETETALKDFEFKNQLYPDGILDALTLRELLKLPKETTKPLLATQ